MANMDDDLEIRLLSIYPSPFPDIYVSPYNQRVYGEMLEMKEDTNPYGWLYSELQWFFSYTLDQQIQMTAFSHDLELLEAEKNRLNRKSHYPIAPSFSSYSL